MASPRRSAVRSGVRVMDEVAVSTFASALAGQIVTNARITARKLMRYGSAVLLVGAGVLVAAEDTGLAAFVG
jgi:hypothetical protein